VNICTQLEAYTPASVLDGYVKAEGVSLHLAHPATLSSIRGPRVESRENQP